MARPPRRRIWSASPSPIGRWSADDARSVLARLDASGLATQEFAAQEGIDRQRLYYWRARLRAAPPAFVEVARTIASTSAIEVVLRSGRVLRVADGFSEETLRRLAQILDDGEPC
jgi:hypothetical protein